MKKVTLAIVLASSALASPALARDNSWYVGVEGGAWLPEESHATIAPGVDVQTDKKIGYDAAGFLGYDFGWFRLEAEYSHKKANNKHTIYSNGFIPNDDGGMVRTDSGMLNGYVDFGPDDGIQGFIGAGAGVSHARVSFPGARDKETGFAWQGMAGLRIPVSSNVDLSAKYRYFRQDHIDIVADNGTPARVNIKSHSALLGLTYNFGGAAEPAPPPPPPPPPPPVAQCAPGPYIVFFEWDKADVTSDAAAILDNAVSAYSTCGGANVMIAGYTDTSGTPRYNQGLSERRANAVKTYLTSKGIGSGAISTKGFGENNLRVDTADGVRELQNRRVEVTYGPGAGQ